MPIDREARLKHLLRAPDWAAAMTILTSPYFYSDKRVWENVDLSDESIYFDKILRNGTFSGGERAMLKIAASLFSTDEKVNLWSELGRLSEDTRKLALEAIAIYCGIPLASIDDVSLQVLQRKAGLRQ